MASLERIRWQERLPEVKARSSLEPDGRSQRIGSPMLKNPRCPIHRWASSGRYRLFTSGSADEFLLPGAPEYTRRLLQPEPSEHLLNSLPLPTAQSPSTKLGPNHHLVHFTYPTTNAELALDGYSSKDAPPSGGPFRRMWAGGKLRFSSRGLSFGEHVQERLWRSRVDQKRGKTWVWLDREYRLVDSDPSMPPDLYEQRCLVYIPITSESPKPFERRIVKRQVPLEPDFEATVPTSTTLLFRYSALTYNAHRIHYDLDYAQRLEGYPTVLVHGPLTCTMLLHLLNETVKDETRLGSEAYISDFEYRATGSVLCGENVRLCGRWVRQQDRAGEEVRHEEDALATEAEGKQFELWAETEAGGLAMTGTAVVKERER